jgi:Holliday junction resolvase-like predicted endonuclease
MNKTKQKGNIGELLVASELTKKGYYVFSELGDNAPIDLIAIPEHDTKKIVRVQVKSTTSKNGTITVSLLKTTKSYVRKYGENDFDLFAVYISDLDKIIYIPLSRVYKNDKSLTIRCAPSKNNQSVGVTLIDNFLDFKI